MLATRDGRNTIANLFVTSIEQYSIKFAMHITLCNKICGLIVRQHISFVVT